MGQPMGMQQTGFAPQATGFSAQPTGFMPQQTGFAPQATGFGPQPTGFAGGGGMQGGFGGMQSDGFGGMGMQQTGFGGGMPPQQTGFMQPQATGFGGGGSMYGQQQQPQQQQPVDFNPMPPSASGGANTVASGGAKHNDPTNIFASMKDGTFASGSTHLPPQEPSRYDALRAQPTGFAGSGMMPQMPQMTGFMPQQQPYGYQQVC